MDKRTFSGSFTQQEPISEEAISAAVEVLRSGRLHRYNLAPDEAGEVALLERKWEQAKQGLGQAVYLSGEPGIGKSRLVQVLKNRVLQDGTPRIEFRCSSYHQNTALYPVIDHLQRLLQFSDQQSAEKKIANDQVIAGPAGKSNRLETISPTK